MMPVSKEQIDGLKTVEVVLVAIPLLAVTAVTTLLFLFTDPRLIRRGLDPEDIFVQPPTLFCVVSILPLIFGLLQFSAGELSAMEETTSSIIQFAQDLGSLDYILMLLPIFSFGYVLSLLAGAVAGILNPSLRQLIFCLFLYQYSLLLNLLTLYMLMHLGWHWPIWESVDAVLKYIPGLSLAFAFFLAAVIPVIGWIYVCIRPQSPPLFTVALLTASTAFSALFLINAEDVVDGFHRQGLLARRSPTTICLLEQVNAEVSDSHINIDVPMVLYNGGLPRVLQLDEVTVGFGPVLQEDNPHTELFNLTPVSGRFVPTRSDSGPVHRLGTVDALTGRITTSLQAQELAASVGKAFSEKNLAASNYITLQITSFSMPTLNGDPITCGFLREIEVAVTREKNGKVGLAKKNN